MKIKVRNELLAISLLTILLIIIITFLPSSVIRVILGLPLVLFFPGYTLISAVFPGKGQISVLRRIALSTALSIVIIPFIGLILNVTPLGITLYPYLVSVTVFILVTSLIAWLRRRTVPDGFSFSVTLPPLAWKDKAPLDKILYVALLVVIIAALGTVIYSFATPEISEPFTEFYILESTGIPLELVRGEKARLTVTIVNREKEAVNYSIEIIINGSLIAEVGPLALPDGDTCEKEIEFVPDRPGDDQQVEFLLYREGQGGVYRALKLHANIH